MTVTKRTKKKTPVDPKAKNKAAAAKAVEKTPPAKPKRIKATVMWDDGTETKKYKGHVIEWNDGEAVHERPIPKLKEGLVRFLFDIDGMWDDVNPKAVTRV